MILPDKTYDDRFETRNGVYKYRRGLELVRYRKRPVAAAGGLRFSLNNGFYTDELPTG